MPSSVVTVDPKTKKPSHAGSLTSTLIGLYKENKDGDLSIFQGLIHEMLHCKSISITDRYASVLLYLHLFSNHTSYDDFLQIIEKESFDTDNKARELALLYGALINSGCVFAWSDDVQMAVIRRLLSLAQILRENDGLILEFFNSYLTRVKQIKFSINDLMPQKLDDVSPRYLHMLCMLEVHSPIKSKKLRKLLKGNAETLAQILLKASNYTHYSDLCVAIIEKRYEDQDNMVLLWETMLTNYNQTGLGSMLPLIIFLSKVVDMTKPEDAHTLIPRFFSLGAGRVFSKNCDTFPKEIIQSFEKGFCHLNGEVKLIIIKSVLTETEKLRDKSMGKRIIDFLKKDLDFDSIKDLCKFYQRIISGKLKRTIKVGDDLKEMDFIAFDRNSFVASYGKLLGHPNCSTQVAWRTKCLKYLFLLGFTTLTNEDDDESIPGVVIGTARKVFYTAVNHRFPRLVDLANTLDKIVLVAGKNMSKKKLNVPVSSQMHAAWKTGQKCLGVLADGEIEEDLAVILQILLLYMLLLLFKDQMTARDAISEIDKVIKNVNLNKSLHWTEVLVDLFLQLLSSSGQCHKQIVSSVFAHLSPHMTPKALDQILKVISDEDDSAEDSDVEDSDSDEEDLVDEKKSEEPKSSDEESDDSDQSDEIEETPNERLSRALREELYQIDTASTAGSVNLDDLDEVEGRKLNDALGKAFRQHGKLPMNKEEKQLKIHFRNRALVLLETVISHNPPVNYILKIVSKLISELKLSLTDKDCHELSTSIKRVLSKCCSIRKFSFTEDCPISSDDLERCMLDMIKSDCSTSVFQEISSNIKDAIVLLVRIAYSLSIDSAPLTNILHGILNSYYTQSDSVYPSHLIVSLLSSQSPCVVSLTPSLVYFAFCPTVKSVKKSIAMECLNIFFKESQFFQKNDRIDWNSIDVATVKLVKKIKKCIKAVANREIELSSNYGIALFDLICLVNNRSQQLGLDKAELQKIFYMYSLQLPTFEGKLRKAYQRCVASLSSKNKFPPKRASSDSESTPVNNNSRKKLKILSKNTPETITPSKKSKKRGSLITDSTSKINGSGKKVKETFETISDNDI